MTNWNLMYDVKPTYPSKFVAVYSDGSGCQMFKASEDSQLREYNMNGCNGYDWVECDWECLDDFTEWNYLPDDFEFFGEK